MQADDEEPEKDKLKVLNDGDGVKLLLDIFNTYVSDDDYVAFIPFMKAVDGLLFKARGNRGLTKEDRAAIEEEAERNSMSKKSRKKKKNKTPPPADSSSNDNSGNGDSGNTEITSSDNSIDESIADFFSRYLPKAS